MYLIRFFYWRFVLCSLQLSVLLEPASASFLLLTLSTFFVNFIQYTIFLYLACVDNEINDPDSDLLLKYAVAECIIRSMSYYDNRQRSFN